MNIKFKMPKFGRRLTGSSMTKELLLTILGTTISIVLTFGTAHLIERRQAEQARKLMAMTIINDMDDTMTTVQRILEAEEEGYGVTIYLMENMDCLDSISDDTLKMFFDYVTPTSLTSNRQFVMQERQYMKNSENILTMSQDSWRTLNDRRFFMNIQEFYNYKALLNSQSEEDVVYEKPFTRNDLSRMLMDTDEMSTREGYVAMCRSMLKSVRVKRYADLHAQRVYDYEYFLWCTIQMIEENKFLMNITEEDMKDFVNGTHMKVRKVSDSDLVGTWENPSPVENYMATFEYRKDHTFTMHVFESMNDVSFRGRIVQRYSIAGTWTIEGDSLVKVFDMKSYKMEVDDSGITYQPNQAAAVERMKKELSQMPHVIKELETNPRISQGLNIDESGTRLQLNDSGAGIAHYRKIK